MPTQSVGVEALKLHIRHDHLEVCRTGARAARPREACGFLIGRLDDAEARVVAVVQARNAATSSGSFSIDALDHLAAERRAKGLGLAVLAAWHSHVAHDATPSIADVAGGEAYPFALIVADGHESRDVRAYLTRGTTWSEVELVVEDTIIA